MSKGNRTRRNTLFNKDNVNFLKNSLNKPNKLSGQPNNMK